MATLTLTFTPASPAPVNGYVVRYRIKDSGGSYTTVNPNPTGSPVIITGLLAGTEYEGDLGADCGYGFSGILTFSTCTCASGFTKDPKFERCYKLETESPTTTHSNWCLALSNDHAYTSLFTRIYN